tara:strand:- start:3320 stop:3709 length:390 start_codon:yes stop_codon:yes gene_type:complete
MIQLINFLLITLILYNLFNNNILEHFSGCSKSDSNAVYRQQAATDRLYGKLNKLEAKYNSLQMFSKINTMGVQSNKQNTEGEIAEFGDDLEDKEAELKKVGGKSSKPRKGNFAGPRNFAGALKSSNNTS